MPQGGMSNQMLNLRLRAVRLTLPEKWLIQEVCVLTMRKHNNDGMRYMKEMSFIAMMDNGGRRLWTDRRKKKLPINRPDRRSGLDRRSGMDRRGLQAVEVDEESERRKTFVGPTLDFIADNS